jgi:hypothetical protein
MAFEPISTNREQDGNRLRIYAGAQWVRPDGKLWVRIDQLVRYAELPEGGYEVTCLGKSVRLFPDAKTKAVCIRNDTADPKHFGPLLDAKTVPTITTWTVECDKQEVNGDVILAEIDGVKLGLFFHDWRRSFGTGYVVKDKIISLDTRALKPTEAAINLDPTTVASTDQTGSLVIVDDANWENDWDASACTPAVDSTRLLVVTGVVGTINTISRGFVQFDTAGVGTVSSAALKATVFSRISLTGVSIYFDIIPDYETLDSTDWGVTPGTRVGSRTLASLPPGTEVSLTVPSGEVNQTGNTCFLLRSSQDVISPSPTPTALVPGVQFYNYNEVTPPVLELTLVGGGSGRAQVIGSDIIVP